VLTISEYFGKHCSAACCLSVFRGRFFISHRRFSFQALIVADECGSLWACGYGFNIFEGRIMMVKMNALAWVVFILLFIGGLNWGLVGLFGFDLVAAIFGEMSTLARVVYTVVGICAVVMLIIIAMGCAPAKKETPA
jgi:uncharacterized protein